MLCEILDNFITYYLPKYYEGKINDTEQRVSKLIEESSHLRKNIDENSEKIEK